MDLKSLFLSSLLIMSTATGVFAQSAAADANKVLGTFSDIEGIDGRWIWATATSMVDLNKRTFSRLDEKMVQLCPEDRGPVMAINTVEDGFNIGLAERPQDLHWQFRRDMTGAYTQSLDENVFYDALGYGADKRPSDTVIDNYERNNGRVTVIRAEADVLLITHRNGFEIYVRCDEN